MDKFGFCVSSEKTTLDMSSFYEFHMRTIKDEKLLDQVEAKFKAINQAIPSLEIGEKYLKSNYRDVYNEWNKIKHELDGINRDRQKFFNKISGRLLKELRKQFHSNPALRLVFGEKWAYFMDTMPLILPSLFADSFVKYDIEKNDEKTYLCYGGLRLVGFDKNENHELETAKIVFNGILSDYNLKDKSRNFYLKLYQLNEKISLFCNNIEKKVVNDIENII